MTAAQQQAHPLKEQIWHAIRELHAITAFFTWLFLLASRLAEPLMTISSIYVIIEAGIPAASVAVLHDSALGIMISAPEIILPGAFILAAHERRQGNEQAWVIQLMCWAFVALTAATLATLFLWKDAPAWVINIVMWLRCVVSIGYSVLVRVLNQSGDGNIQRGQSQQVQDQVTKLLNQFREDLRGVQSQFYQGVQQVVQQEVQREIQLLHTEIQKAIEPFPKPMQDQAQHAQRNRLNLLPEQRAEYHVPAAGSERGSEGSTRTGQGGEPPHAELLQAVHTTPKVNPGSEPSKGAVNPTGRQGEQGARVQRFITEQLAKGHTPTLKEIRDACQCSKNTAIQHRRALISNADEQEAVPPKLTLIRG